MKFQYLRYGFAIWELKYYANETYPWAYYIKHWVMFPKWLRTLNTFLGIKKERRIKE
jgi:hypothetical protein